jgi:hypothetical protein
MTINRASMIIGLVSHVSEKWISRCYI